jgi:hypothetical protein
VQAVAARAGEEGVSITALASALNLDKASASRRWNNARARGYLKNLETGRGKPARIVLADPLPHDIEVLPTLDALRRNLDDLDDLDDHAPGVTETPPPPPPDAGPEEIEVLAELWRLGGDGRCHFCQREDPDLVQSPTDPAMWWCPPDDVDCNFHARLRLHIPRRIALTAKARELTELDRGHKEPPAS